VESNCLSPAERLPIDLRRNHQVINAWRNAGQSSIAVCLGADRRSGTRIDGDESALTAGGARRGRTGGQQFFERAPRHVGVGVHAEGVQMVWMRHHAGAIVLGIADVAALDVDVLAIADVSDIETDILCRGESRHKGEKCKEGCDVGLVRDEVLGD